MPDAFRHALGSAAAPVLVGLVYGLWALAIQRRGEAASGGEILRSVLAGLAVAVLFALLHHPAKRLAKEPRSLAWGVSAGAAVGYLHSLANTSVLWSSTLGLLVAAGVLPIAFYRFYSQEE
ncbi:hypothetical protein [Streptomyces boncukensis]|uniref:Uncharacterized protein n=1 Tax=Streptomyces boncukensis TaxID=2711219 RepID=A0A6G4X309_9ACTN|nr:hypothetical protein [Streptomyces boncukensis]NGO71237.1 hypothetical protein [Streptomyces boncukensis]